MVSGKIQTVLGPIDPSAVGRTLTHEHITVDYRCCLRPPWRESDAEKMTNSEFNLANLGWIHQNPYSHKFNLALGDEPFDDMVKELNLFKQEGGHSIVEVSTVGRNVEFLAKASSTTGLNIIAGTGCHSGHPLPSGVKASSVEELSMVCEEIKTIWIYNIMVLLQLAHPVMVTLLLGLGGGGRGLGVLPCTPFHSQSQLWRHLRCF